MVDEDVIWQQEKDRLRRKYGEQGEEMIEKRRREYNGSITRANRDYFEEESMHREYLRKNLHPHITSLKKILKNIRSGEGFKRKKDLEDDLKEKIKNLEDVHSGDMCASLDSGIYFRTEVEEIQRYLRRKNIPTAIKSDIKEVVKGLKNIVNEIK